MSRRNLGLGLIAIGSALILSGVLVATSGSPDEAITAQPATTTTVRTPSTTPETTTTSPSVTTTTTSQTTTTLRPETVEEFVDLFAAALTSGDQEFVVGRLHPAVIEGYTEEACRTWVGDEIMALSDYRLTGAATGPVDKGVSIAGQPATIVGVYSAPVSFTFRGQSFDSTADFAVVEGLVRWLGSCE